MEIKRLHDWELSAADAIKLQRRLAVQISRIGQKLSPHYIAGVDVSVRRGEATATGSVVVLSYPELMVIETRTVRSPLNFPYVPGLLSFREMPIILAAYEQLTIAPDLVLVDGQGIAHPRRMGIASHLGLFLDRPTIGCAKSLLCGSHETPGNEPGDYAEIVDNNETIGVALRTKTGVKPVYVSTGHRTSLPQAIEWVMKCCKGYRLPEPARLAHQSAKHSRLTNDREAAIAGA